MRRIIIHWTAGPHKPTGLDLHHYHYVIDGAGQVHPGRFAVSANAGPLEKGAYAAHTLNCNSGSIGVALAAMAGAQERPFQPGNFPITPAQVTALVLLCRDLAARHAIAVTPQTVLTHAEVQPRLGIAQRGKWDVTWLPGMDLPGAALGVGDRLRALIVAPVPPAAAVQKRQEGWIASLIGLVGSVFSPKNRRLA